MTNEEILVTRELAEAIKALADALTPKLGGMAGPSPLFTVRCECHCGQRQHYGAPWYSGGAG